MSELRASSHGVAMITGDAALTACAVARRVGICDRTKDRMLVLSPVKKKADEVEWVVAANQHRAPRPGLLKRLDFVPTKESATSLATEYDLCVTGAALERIGGGGAAGSGVEEQRKRLLSVLRAIAPSVAVFAVSLFSLYRVVSSALPVSDLFPTPSHLTPSYPPTPNSASHQRKRKRL